MITTCDTQQSDEDFFAFEIYTEKLFYLFLFILI